MSESRETCGEWSESREQLDERIDLALRHMMDRERRRMERQERPARQYSLREIGDYVGVDPTVIMRIEKRALATIRENYVESIV